MAWGGIAWHAAVALRVCTVRASIFANEIIDLFPRQPRWALTLANRAVHICNATNPTRIPEDCQHMNPAMEADNTKQALASLGSVVAGRQSRERTDG